MMRAADEFKQAAKARNIKKWLMHDCSICGYHCGYKFTNNYDEVSYDSGCNCVDYKCVTPRTWDDVANYYNMQGSIPVIEEMDEFWGFK